MLAPLITYIQCKDYSKMKNRIEFSNEYNKHYIELIPSITISYSKPVRIAIGWLYFFVFIEFRKSKSN